MKALLTVQRTKIMNENVMLCEYKTKVIIINWLYLMRTQNQVIFNDWLDYKIKYS